MSASVLSPEDQLLLLCCRNRLDGDRREALRGFVFSALAWESLLRKARYHRLLGLIRHHLIDSGLYGEVPPDQRQLLEEHAAHMDVAARQQLDTLKDVAALMLQRSIDYLLLKGPTLQHLYPAGVVRAAGDIDLVVHEDTYSAVIAAFEDSGFECATKAPRSLAPESAVAFSQYFEQLRFVRADSTEVEVHFRLYNYGLPDAVEDSWQKRRDWEVAGAAYPGLEREDLFLYLTTHVNLHAFGRILWYYDVTTAYRQWRQQLDWDRMEMLARRRRLSSSFYHSLCWMFGLLFPECHLPELERFKPSAVATRIFAVAWREREVFALKSFIRPFDAARYYLLGAQSAWDKLRYVWRVLLPRKEWLAAYLNRQAGTRLHLTLTYLRQRRRENRDWNRVTKRDELLG